MFPAVSQATWLQLITWVSLLFWAWHIDVLWMGALVTILLIAALFFKGRYSFDTSSFFQIADLCALIAFGIFAFIWIDDKASQAVYPTLRMLPIAFLPLLLFQILDKKQQTPVSTVMFLQRKLPTNWFDVTPFFIVICLFAAGAVKTQQWTYFTGVFVILFTMMFAFQMHARWKRQLWMMLLFAVAIVLALVLQWGLEALQKRLEANINQWLLNQHGAESTQTSTAIGAVGRLKLSDAILFRVEPIHGHVSPMLLREGSYQRYSHGMWFGGSWADKSVPFVQGMWRLTQPSSDTKHNQQLRFYQPLNPKKQTLALPAFTSGLQNLPADTVQIQQGGSVVVKGGQAFVSFDAFRDTQSKDSVELLEPSQAVDFKIQRDVAEAVTTVANQLNLHDIRETFGDVVVLQTIKNYFWKQYTYSTWLTATSVGQKPLVTFLLKSHTGHCEYFASATVLLLREVGIPARYAVGYAMNEWDAKAGLYLVRGRDAHAWALAEIDGVWVNADFTPPNWLAMENEDSSQFQSLKDFWSSVLFTFKKWRYADTDYTEAWLSLLVILFSFLAWRVLRRVNVEEKISVTKITKEKTMSAWNLLDDELVKRGFVRYQGESLTSWVTRIHQSDLLPIIAVYYQQRFGEVSLDPAQQQAWELAIEVYRKKLVNQSTV